MKSAKLEWCLGDITRAKELLDESVKHYPNFPKLWLMRGQIEQQRGADISAVRDVYNQGVRICVS